MKNINSIIHDHVINDVETLLSLAKKKRKILKPNDILEMHSIDASELWNLLQQYSLKLSTKKVPSDIMRMIFRLMPAKDYYRIASQLNHKYRMWVREDVTIVKLSIEYHPYFYHFYYANKITYPYSFTFTYPNTPQTYRYSRHDFFCKAGSNLCKTMKCFYIEMTNGKITGYTSNTSNTNSNNTSTANEKSPNSNKWMCNWKTIYQDNRVNIKNYSVGFEYDIECIPEIQLKTYWRNKTKNIIYDADTSPSNALFDHANIIIKELIIL